MGCNAIRVTHNPAAEALIDICNREGMLVIDEAFDGWSHAKNSNNNDYARFFNVKIEESNQILGKSQDMTWGEFDVKAMVKRGIINKLANAIDGSKEFKTGNNKVIWDDWERNTYHTDQNWYAVLFDSTNIINKVSVGFTLETNGAQNRVNLPKDYEIQYYTGPDFTLDESNMKKVKNWAEDHPLKDPNNWKTVVYTSDKPAVPSEENDDFKRMVDINFQPIEARLVRISFVPQENQWVGLEEFEVYSGGSITKENDSFEVVSVTIEGNNILDQLLSDTGYSRELAEDEIIPEILVSATNNAKITIQRPETEEGIVIISILPENGDLTKKVVYHLEFTRKQVIALVEEILLTPSTEEGLVVLTGNTQQFTAVVKGTGEFYSTVIWSVEGASSQGTTIDEKGLLTVDSGETADSLTVKAVSAADSSKTAVTNVTIKKVEPSNGNNPQQTPTDPSQGTTPGGDSPNHVWLLFPLVTTVE